MRQLAVEELGPLCAEQASQVTLLDVREPWEVATAALTVAGVPTVRIPMNEIPATIG